jgi:hypothetical protein
VAPRGQGAAFITGGRQPRRLIQPVIASLQRASSENAPALLLKAGWARHNDLHHPSTRPLTLKRNAYNVLSGRPWSTEPEAPRNICVTHLR